MTQPKKPVPPNGASLDPIMAMFNQPSGDLGVESVSKILSAPAPSTPPACGASPFKSMLHTGFGIILGVVLTTAFMVALAPSSQWTNPPSPGEAPQPYVQSADGSRFWPDVRMREDIAKSLNLNFEEHESQLQENSVRFTPAGLKSFNDMLRENRILSALTETRVSVSAASIQSPQVLWRTTDANGDQLTDYSAAFLLRYTDASGARAHQHLFGRVRVRNAHDAQRFIIDEVYLRPEFLQR